MARINYGQPMPNRQVSGDPQDSNDPWKISLNDTGSRTYTYQPQAYIDALEKYKNDPEVLARLKAVVRSFTYNSFPFESVASFFGADPLRKLQGEYALNADNAISEIINNAATRDYNSEAAQKSRMAAAGMNPDLMGIGDAASQNMIPPDETLPNVGGAFPTEAPIMEIGQGIMNIIPTIMSVAQSFQSLKMQDQELFKSRVGSVFGASDEFMKDALRSAPAFSHIPFDEKGFNTWVGDLDDDQEGEYYGIKIKKGMSFDEAKSKYREKVFNDWITKFVNSRVEAMPKRFRNRLMGQIGMVLNSDQFSRMRAAVSAGKVEDFYRAAEGMSNTVWDGDFNTFLTKFNDSFGSYQSEIFRLNKELEKKGLDIAMLENAYNDDYWRNLNGMTAAQAENLQNEAQKAADKYNESENSFWTDLLDQMPDNWFGQLLTLGVMFLRANSSQGFRLPAVSHGSSHRSGQRDKQWNPIQGIEHGENQGSSSWFSLH